MINHTLLYQEIYQALKIRMLSSYQIYRLPSERKLAEEFKVSRVTIRHALNLLKQEGLINKKDRSASFIKDSVFKHDMLYVQSLKEEFTSIGVDYTVDIMTFKKIPASQELASILCLEESEDVYFVRRLISVESVPSIYECSYMPCYLFPDLTKKDVIVKYDYIEKEKKMCLQKVHRKIMAIIPSKSIMKNLRLKNEAVLYISMNAELADKRICEYVQQYFHPKHYFTISSSRNI